MTESKPSSFWSTLPGLVTAIAGMITAIAILVTTLATLPSAPSATTAPTDVHVGPGDGVIRPIMVIAAAGGTARRATTNGLGPAWGS